MRNKKVVIVTGASQGLGLEICKDLLINNYSISICSKNKSRLIHAYKYLLNFKKKNQEIYFKAVDVTNETQVKNFIKLTIKKFKKVYALVNNAGILGPKGKLHKLNHKNWKETVDINLYGSLFTCKNLIPHFLKKKEGKIIQLSGAGALTPMENFTAYSASKAAVVRLADTLAEEFKDKNIQINSIAAGAINTQMLSEIIKAGPKKVGRNLFNRIKLQKKNGGIPFKKVTDLIIYLLKKESNFINGKIISPRWDKWKSWKKNKKLLKNTDVFALRRIRGKDRGYILGDN